MYVDDGSPVDVLYMDFSKAFDKVPHERLLKKLSAHGTDARITNWIRAWLCDRKQRVVINGVSSSWCRVTCGVPQGSVLGPLLFIIYINDTDRGVCSKILKFVDDTKIYRKVSTGEEAACLQNDMQISGLEQGLANVIQLF